MWLMILYRHRRLWTIKIFFKAMEISKEVEKPERWLDMKYDEIRFILKNKKKRCRAFRQELVRCKNKEIIADQVHRFWRCGTSREAGTNMMGKLLMDVAQEVETSAEDLLPSWQASDSLRGIRGKGPGGRPSEGCCGRVFYESPPPQYNWGWQGYPS